MSKPAVIEEIEKLLGLKMTEARTYGDDRLSSLMRYKKGAPRYAVDKTGRLIGLNLSDIGLSDETLEKVLSIEDLKKEDLQVLNLSYNGLTEFRLSRDLLNLTYLNLEDNPLIFPEKSVLDQGKEFTLQYLKDLLTQGEREVFEVKMLIVGEGGVGKTTLWEKLQNPNHPVPLTKDKQPMTVGIEIREGWSFNHLDRPNTPFLVNLWDFGGQEIQYMTHQFFLTRRSFYVLLADGRKEIANFSYWFKVINLLGYDENQKEPLPVLVVLNEQGNPITDIPYDPNEVKNDFPNLEIIRRDVDLKEKEGRFASLVHEIKNILCRRIEHLPLSIPLVWDLVRQDLSELKKERNHIGFEEKFTSICKGHGIEDKTQLKNLSQWFHDLGLILHYQDDPRLANFIILNPQWAVNAIYEILRHESVEKNQGRFKESLLLEVWEEKGYSMQERANLINLMIKDSFEVCFAAEEKGESIFIAPQLLPKKSPDFKWSKETGNLRYTYQYPFMPKGLIWRLIVRLHKYLEDNEEGNKVIWKLGMVLEQEGSRALIKETTDAKTGGEVIEIEIRGEKGESCRFLLKTIRDELDHIHKRSFPSLRYYEKIPCHCEKCYHSDEPQFYELSNLKDRLEQGQMTVECGKSYKPIFVKRLLEGVFAGERAPEFKNQLKKPRTDKHHIFISYAHEDEIYKDKLIKQLATLKRQQLIETWNDHDLVAGEWDSQIETAMENADIFLLLITDNFLSSDYIMSKEVIRAYEKYKEGTVKIFPIICDYCDWEDAPISELETAFHGVDKVEKNVWLGRFKYFPKNGTPISDCPNPSKAYLEVVKSLKEEIKRNE